MVKPSRDRKPDFVIDADLTSTLLQTFPHLTFQIVAQPDAIGWQILDSRGMYSQEAVASTIRSRFDEQIEVVAEPVNESDRGAARLPFYRQHVLFYLTYEYPLPLPFVDMLKNHDPLTTMTRRMDFLKAEFAECMVSSLVVVIASEEAQARGMKRLQEGYIVNLQANTDKIADTPDKKLLMLIKAKLAGPLYHCFLVLTLESQEQNRLEELALAAGDITKVLAPELNCLRSHPSHIYAIETIEDAEETSQEQFLADWMTDANQAESVK